MTLRASCVVQREAAMNDLGKVMVVGGVVIAVIGLLIWSGFGRGWFGQLPGEIHIKG